jgi:hypothetical protein
MKATPTKKAKAGARALSLHIGLNAVSPKAYGGWDGQLAACEFDAKDMADIARSQGITPTVLLTKQGTRDKVLTALRNAAKTLVSGDLFVMSYSGHGGQVPDVTGDEPDKKDETWCLYDGQLIDDELYLELSRFAKGVRVLVLSDSCHSGTVTRAMPSLAATVNGVRPRMMPPSVALRTYNENQKFYDDLQEAVAKAAGGKTLDPDAVLSTLSTASNRVTGIAQGAKASIILISGCQDNQTSMDGEHNGAFTEQLLRVWDEGRFVGNHTRFHQLIRANMPPTQSPNLFTLGPVSAFRAQQPFKV